MHNVFGLSYELNGQPSYLVLKERAVYAGLSKNPFPDRLL
jgi:hypothetical protein